MFRIIQGILIILKLFKIITVSWWIVFAPTLFVGGIIVSIFLIIVVCACFTDKVVCERNLDKMKKWADKKFKK